MSSTMRRPSTCSETSSVSSGSTAYSIVKEPPQSQSETLQQEKRKKRGLRQKARDMVHDIGQPPTARQDAKDGKRTLNYAPLGGMIGEPLTRPAKV